MPDTTGWNGYTDWSLELAGLNDGECPDHAPDPSELWEPLYLRVPSGTECDAFLAHAEKVGRDGGFWINPIERQFLDVLNASEDSADIIAYRRLDQRDAFSGTGGGKGSPNDMRFETVTCGPFIRADALPNVDRIAARDPFLPPKLVFGIIDDGLGPLHGRTRQTQATSRIEKVLWLTAQPGSSSVQSVGQINAELSRAVQRMESDAYRVMADAVYAPTTRHSLRQSQTHGAHMLDLAAGSGVGKSMARVPILATQVAPESFDDTSGIRLNFDILTGLRWMILETALLAGRGTPVDLVVNMSLGYLAGPKNGRSFIEQAIARLMHLAEHYLHVSVHLMVPYGNAYSDNVVARADLAAGATQDFNLRVQPDDRTPSYLELRLTDQSAEQDPALMEVTITAPRGGLQANVFALASGQHADLRDTANRLLGRLYHIPARPLFGGVVEPAYLLLALAPTRRTRSDAELTCPSGQWQISVRNLGFDHMDLTAQVQRDDDPSSRNTGARQARLEGGETRAWDPVSRTFEGIDPALGPVTRAGTNSALSTIPHHRVTSVGGALVRRDPAVPAHRIVEPAEYYGAEGADWSGHRPDMSAISEVERRSPGVTAAGLLSAGNARLSGSSTACATAARDLVNRLTGQLALPDEIHPAGDPRLGHRTILDNPAIRRRL